MFTFLQQQIHEGKELEFGGFDCKFTSSYGRKGNNYSRQLIEQIKTVDPQFVKSNEFISYLHFWNKIEQDMKKGGIRSLSFKMNEREQSDFSKQSQFILHWLYNKGQLEWAQIVNAVDKGILLYTDFSIGKVLFNKQ